jgi:hypothetical protein
MPARKPTPPGEKPQFERFIETAKKVGADETDEAFERAIDKIAPPRLGRHSDSLEESVPKKSRV